MLSVVPLKYVNMNLVYCTSPLHVLIAERIIDLYPSEQFYCIFDGDPSLSKQWHYYERLKARCQGGLFIHRKFHSNPLKAYLYMMKIVLTSYRLPRIKRIFTGSIASNIFRLLWPGIRTPELYTFDDGCMNLSPEAYERIHSTPEGGFIRLVRKLFTIPSVEEFKARSLKHYTIYQYSNVMPRCEYVSLQLNKGYSDVCFVRGDENKTKVISILLGQRVFSWDKDKDDIALTEHIISTYGIGYYLPHPKESYTIKGVEYIQTPLIAEDYILQILEENPDLEVRLYSYCSTALLNLSATPRVRVRAIKPKKYLPLLEETFDNYSRLGIPMDCLD